ncbi:hypothetical protein EV361DRAFT_889841 [Lentinula raphanica]|nr:hypothetical protein EV361DRAFT_889841 [Lentinula raphanica]
MKLSNMLLGFLFVGGILPSYAAPVAPSPESKERGSPTPPQDDGKSGHQPQQPEPSTQKASAESTTAESVTPQYRDVCLFNEPTSTKVVYPDDEYDPSVNVGGYIDVKVEDLQERDIFECVWSSTVLKPQSDELTVIKYLFTRNYYAQS